MVRSRIIGLMAALWGFLVIAGESALPGAAGPLIPVSGLNDGPRSFTQVIEELSGSRVLDWTGEHATLLSAVSEAALLGINREGVRARRVNEVGNAVEEFVDAAFEAHGFTSEVPFGPSGRRRSTGYPDLRVSRDGVLFYIEVKTYNRRNVDTTQRSFYLSPSEDFKVVGEGYHLVIAFAMKREDDGRYRAESVHLLDLHGLVVKLKWEYNASNRDLYGGELETIHRGGLSESADPASADTTP